MKNLILSLLLIGLLGLFGASGASALEKRIALVVGEASYRAKPLATAANDAGLIAQTLQAAGFDVTGARDLDGDALRKAFVDFLDKASSSGPETAAFIYFSGYGLQLEGENYLVPIDASIARDTDIPMRAARVSDFLKPLAALNLKTTVVVLDAARENPFALSGQPIAGGLALSEPPPNLLLAYNAAPGTIAPVEAGPYGAYAHALAEMIRAGGMPLTQVFEETRLRVSEVSKGGQIPWNSKAGGAFMFLERTAQAPNQGYDAALQSKPISQLSPADAYTACVQRDTLQGYQDYLAAYPTNPQAKRVRAMLAARREALFWRRARTMDTPGAYWSYLRRYPHGPHYWDARRRLEDRAVAMEPPQGFEPVDMGYPPPPPEEIIYVDRPVLYFADPVFGFAPPPPAPIYFLPPPPPDFVVLAPPVVFGAAYVLPVPVFVPMPVYVTPPPFIAPPPPNNIFFANIHNAVVVNPVAQNFVVSNPQGHILSTGALTAVGAGAAGLAIGASLPHFLGKQPAAAPVAPGTGLAPRHVLPTNPPTPTPGAGALGAHVVSPGAGSHFQPGAVGAAPGAASPAKQPAPHLSPATAAPPRALSPAAASHGATPGAGSVAAPPSAGAIHAAPPAIHAAPAPRMVPPAPRMLPQAPRMLPQAPPAAMHMPTIRGGGAPPAFRGAPARGPAFAPAARPPAPRAPANDHGAH